MAQIIDTKNNKKIKKYLKNDDKDGLFFYIKTNYPNVYLHEFTNREQENLLHLATFYEAKNITAELIKNHFSLFDSTNKLGKKVLFEALSTSSDFFSFIISNIKSVRSIEEFNKLIYQTMQEVDGNGANFLYNTIEYGNEAIYNIVKEEFLNKLDSQTYINHLEALTNREHTLAHVILEKKTSYAYSLLNELSIEALTHPNFGFGFTPAMLGTNYGNQEGLEALHYISRDTWQGLSQFGDNLASIAVFQNNFDLLDYILKKEPNIAFLKKEATYRRYKKASLLYSALNAENDNIALRVFEHFRDSEKLGLFNPNQENGTYDSFLQACYHLHDKPQVFHAYVEYLKNHPEIVQSYNLKGEFKAEKNQLTIEVVGDSNQAQFATEIENDTNFQSYQTKDPLSFVLAEGSTQEVKALLDIGFVENKLPSAFRGYFNIALNSKEAKEKTELLLEHQFSIFTFENNKKTLKEADERGYHLSDYDNLINVLRIQIHPSGQIFDTLKDYFLPNLMQSKLTEEESLAILNKIDTQFSAEDYYLALYFAIEGKKTNLVKYCLKHMQLAFNKKNKSYLSEKDVLKNVHEYMSTQTDFKNSKYLNLSFFSHLNQTQLEEYKDVLSIISTLFYNGLEQKQIFDFQSQMVNYLGKYNIKNKAFLNLLLEQSQKLLSDDILLSTTHSLLNASFGKLDANLFNHVFANNKTKLNIAFDQNYFDSAQLNFNQIKNFTVNAIDEFFCKIKNPHFKNIAMKSIFKNILFYRRNLSSHEDTELDAMAYYIMNRLTPGDLADLISKPNDEGKLIFKQLDSLSLNDGNYHVVEKYFKYILPFLEKQSNSFDYNELFNKFSSKDRSFLPILTQNISQIYDKVDLTNVAMNFIKNDSISDLVASNEQFMNPRTRKEHEAQMKKDAKFLQYLLGNLNLEKDKALLAPVLSQDHLIDLALENNKLYLVKAMLEYLNGHSTKQYELYQKDLAKDWNGYLLSLSTSNITTNCLDNLVNQYIELSEHYKITIENSYRGQNVFQTLSNQFNFHDVHKEQAFYARSFMIMSITSKKLSTILDDFIAQPHFLKDFSNILLHYTKLLNCDKHYYNDKLSNEITNHVVTFLDNIFIKLDKERFNFIYQQLSPSLKESQTNENDASKIAREKLFALFEKHKMDKIFTIEQDGIKKRMKI